MKRFLFALVMLMLVGSSSLFAINNSKSVTVEKCNDGGPDGWNTVYEIPTQGKLVCCGPGFNICELSLITTPTWAPNNSLEDLYEYANNQIFSSNYSGSYSANVYFNGEFVYRNVTWEKSISTGTETITINLFTL